MTADKPSARVRARRIARRAGLVLFVLAALAAFAFYLTLFIMIGIGPA